MGTSKDNQPEDAREAAMHGLRAYLSQLRSQADRLAEDIASVERSIELLDGAPPLTSGSSGPASSGYEKLGPQAAVERLLSENPRRAWRSAAAARQLVANGFRATNPKLLPTQVATAFNRAVNKHVAIRTSRAGKTMYRLAQEEDL